MCGRAAERLRRICKAVRSIFQDSPAVCLVITVVLAILLLIGGLFSFLVSQYLGSRLTVVVDLSAVWLLARLIARSLLFPGSVKLFQRNTEATFRTEMSRQYAHFVRQFLSFAKHAAHMGAGGISRGVTVDGAYRGYSVIETLAKNFTMQQTQHEVSLNAPQAELQAVVQDIDRWMRKVQVRLVRERPGQVAPAGHVMPLVEWLRAQASAARHDSHSQCLESVEFAGSLEEAAAAIDRMEVLLSIFDELRHAAKSCFSTVKRFMCEPAVGSLNQLRSELQMRYGGQRCWVHGRGRHKIDGMFIPCDGSLRAQNDEAKEDAPLKGGVASRTVTFSGPTVIWCNPNAGYYETMVYQASWLNFWLRHGINLFLFNYSGYGSSTGLPTPARIAQDGDAIVAFLKSKGIKEIGVYGRSIGGVTACHLAQRHPGVIKLLIADRTMSQLQTAAKYLYGAWAAAGLQLTRMIHDNVDRYWEVRCYKLLIVDPKDTMILDLASLRTAVALRVLERLRPEERFDVDDETLAALSEVWRFFQALFAVCERDEEGMEIALGHEPLSGASVRRDARTPVLLRDDQRSASAGPAELLGASGSAASSSSGSRERVGANWLQEHAGVVRSTVGMFVDQLRAIMDTVGERIEGGGTSLNDVFLENPGSPGFALQCMLANIQVWGTVGNVSMDYDGLGEGMHPLCHPSQPDGGADDGGASAMSEIDRDIEAFLRKDLGHEFPMNGEATPQRLREIGRSLLPEALLNFHRRLARTQVCQARKELRRRLNALQPALASCSAAAAPEDAAEAERLVYTVHSMLGDLESFVSSLGRFFKNVDLALSYSRQQQQQHGARGVGHPRGGGSAADPTGLSDSSDERMADCGGESTPVPRALRRAAAERAAPPTPQPSIDHVTAGYTMHIDCGHNGVMDEVDLRQLALHLRAARFGRTPPEYC